MDLDRVLEILQENRTQNEIDALQIRLENAKEGSAEFLKIQQELNDKLLAQAKAQADKEAKIEEDKLAKRVETAENAGNLLISLSQKVSEKRIGDIDKAIEDSAQRESELAELAKNGSEQALETLEFERKKQAELALAREKELERQARRELALSGAKIFSSKIAGGQQAGQALAETGAELLALQSLNSLPAFYEGAERVGDEIDPLMSGKDGHVIRVDGDERILSPSQNALIPKGLSNLELAMMAHESKAVKSNNNDYSNRLLVSKLDAVKKAIEDKPVMTDRVFDSEMQATISTLERKGRLERRHKRISTNGK